METALLALTILAAVAFNVTSGFHDAAEISAPAVATRARFRDEFGLPEAKLAYLVYGFDLQRLAGRSRTEGEAFTFGYIGTHIPAKGVHHLIEAFGQVSGQPRLRIWGRERRHSCRGWPPRR